MILTESEARRKWCPFAREIERHDAVAATNRDTLCMGSGCMAWRYVSGGLDGEERGYCGLAGQPHVTGANLLEARINPEDYASYLDPDLYGSEDTIALVQALLDAGVHIGHYRGHVVVGGEALAMAAFAEEAQPYGDDLVSVGLNIRARVPDPRSETLMDMECRLVGFGQDRDAAIADAAALFIAGALDPMRRSVADDCLSLSDMTLNLSPPPDPDAGERSTTFYMVFRGALQTGEVNETLLANKLRHGIIEWLCGQGHLQVTPPNMALFKLTAMKHEDGRIGVDCTINGEPWDRGNELLAGFDWPEGDGVQRIREFVVMRVGG